MVETQKLPARRFGGLTLILAAAVSVVATLAVVGLLVNIFERKQEGQNPFYRVVELTDDTEDPAIWGRNFPQQYDAYLRTVDQERTRFGGSEAVPRTPTNVDPRSRRGAITARGRSAAEDSLGWIRLFEGLSGGAWACAHARRPDVHRAATGHEPAGHVYELPCVGVCAVQEARRRRHLQRLCKDESNAVLRRPQDRQPPGGMHRLS